MGIELITKNGNITLTKPTGTGGGTVDLSNYYTKAETDEAIAKAQPDLTEYLTNSELEAKGYITGIPDEYITENELSSKGFQTADDVIDKIDYYCHDFVTLDTVEDTVATAVSDKVTTEQLNTATANFVTETQMNTAIEEALSTLVDGEAVSY